MFEIKTFLGTVNELHLFFVCMGGGIKNYVQFMALIEGGGYGCVFDVSDLHDWYVDINK